MEKRLLTQLMTDIVSSHAQVNEMTQEQLLAEMDSVYKKLLSLAGEEAEGGLAEGTITFQEGQPLKPALPVNKAFGATEVFCLVCGKSFTTLKKHLSTAHQMTPKDYRKAFGIPSKTPLVARKYSESKKRIAQEKGLALKLAEGRKKRQAAKGK